MPSTQSVRATSNCWRRWVRCSAPKDPAAQLCAQRLATLLVRVQGVFAAESFAQECPVELRKYAAQGAIIGAARLGEAALNLVSQIPEVEARVLVIIYAVYSLWAGLSGRGGDTAVFAHLGGFAGAFLYLRWIETTQGARKFRAAVQPKVADRALTNWKRVDPKNVHEVNRDELNRVLDKVGRSGLASLTAEEKRFLMSFVPPDDRPPMVS